MSDSDDTDLLLQIPPDSFVLNSSNNTVESFTQFLMQSENPTSLQMSGNYNLSSRHQLELENIDARLSKIEKDFPASCEISSITNDETQFLNYKDQNFSNISPYSAKSPMNEETILSNTLYHSTARCGLPMKKDVAAVEDTYKIKKLQTHNIVNDIDQFLEKNESSFKTQVNKLPSNHFPPWNSSTPQKLSFNCETVQQHLHSESKLSSKANVREDEMNLISLSELWNANNGCNENLSLQEERLRRQHCEKIIKSLQNRLLEYQQRISVAIQVDRTKDNVLEKIQEENHRLRVLTNELNDKLLDFERQKNEFSEKLRLENEQFKVQKETLEKELSQALSLAAKFQDKNEILEMKVESLTRTSSEIGSVYKKQIEGLEIKLSNNQKHEQIINEELSKLRVQCENLKMNHEKISKENLELKKQLEKQNYQLEQIKQDKLSMNRKLDEAKKEINELEKKKKNLEEHNTEIIKKEKCFLKELENQRISLKSHYQQQLENVVSQKLKEFQAQLDNVEETLKTEARERERIIAERAITQVEMINEKNEQEIMLLNEKHNKEVELYRIQLANSSKKIIDLEEILEDYRSRRADIAEKLHNIMETQWKKALEILTSPNGGNNKDDTEIFSKMNPQNIDQGKLDGLQKCSKTKSKPENECFETPTSIRYKKSSDDDNQKNIDRLQAYIEFLLNKSPSDLDNLQEILAMPKTASTRQINKNEKIKNEGTSTKPPWK